MSVGAGVVLCHVTPARAKVMWPSKDHCPPSREGHGCLGLCMSVSQTLSSLFSPVYSCLHPRGGQKTAVSREVLWALEAQVWSDAGEGRDGEEECVVEWRELEMGLDQFLPSLHLVVEQRKLWKVSNRTFSLRLLARFLRKSSGSGSWDHLVVRGS